MVSPATYEALSGVKRTSTRKFFPSYLFVEMELKVPRRSAGQGYIQVRGGSRGGGFRSCFYDGEYCARRIAARYPTFDALLEGLANKRGNNSLTARLRLGRRQSTVVSRDKATVDKVVSGDGFVQVTVGDADGGGEPVPSKPGCCRG